MIRQSLYQKITISPRGVVGAIFKQFIADNNLKGGNMRKRAWQFPIVAVVAIMMFAIFGSTAGATRFSGACGGGTTLNDFIAGAKAHGVLDDLARKTGQTPGVDGSAAKIVKDNYVRVIVTKGTYVTNYTCTGGSFKRLTRHKFLPAGTVLWMPAKNAPSKGKTKVIHDAAQENCGNEATGNIPVKRPGHVKKSKKHKKHSTKKKVSTGCNNQTSTNVNSGNACQQNSSTQNANQESTVKNDCKGPNTNSTQCQTTIIQVINQTTIQVNANCSKVNITYSNGDTKVEYQDNAGNVVTESYCSTTVVNPPCTTDCAPQPSTAECTSFVLETNPAVNLGVKARVDYRASNATLSSVSFAWGDGNTTTGTSQEAAHVYSSLGTYTVIATLKFTTPSGNVSVTCSAKQITPKDGTPGLGSGSGSTGGSGAGGTGSSGSGQTCIDPVSGDPRPMASNEHEDNHGFCRLNV